MKSRNYLVSIEPPRLVTERIKKARSIIVQQSTDLYRGPNNPHITLFINSYDPTKLLELEEQLEMAVKCHRSSPAVVKGMHIFDDPIARASTFVYEVQSTDALGNLQRGVVNALNPLRTRAQEEWLMRQNPDFTEEQQISLRNYGYPFGPENWRFHTTIGSVPTKDAEKIKEAIKKLDKKASWNVGKVDLHEDHGNGNYRLVRSYSLD